MAEGDRAGQTREAGQAKLRLCNLVAQSPADAESGLQEGGRAGTNRGRRKRGRLSTSNRTRAMCRSSRKQIETAARMLGSDRSRGYCLEMTCADFLAGANLDCGDPETLLFSMTRFFGLLPENRKQAFLDNLSEKAS